MALQKQPVAINFSKGVDQKTDPYQLAIDSFTKMQNSVFTKTGRLTKRNGFADVTQLPDTSQTSLTTLNDNLIATGSSLYAFSQDTNQWLNRGIVQPISLKTQSLVRVSTSQVSPDAAVAPNGLTLLTYMDGGLGYYQVSDSATGQQIVQRVTLPNGAISPRAFTFGSYFIVTFLNTITATNHLQFIAVPIAAPASPLAPQDISVDVASITTAGYDGVVANNSLYISWATASATVKTAYITSSLIVSSAATIAGHTANLITLAVDSSASTSVIWVSSWDSSSTNTYTTAYNPQLLVVKATALVFTGVQLNALSSIAASQTMTLFYEVNNLYSSTGANPQNAKTDFVNRISVPQVGSIGTPSTILRSVGLASKPFVGPDSMVYMLMTYGETNQPTYFLVNLNGSIYMRLAYANGGGYAANQVLPTVSLVNGNYIVPYLIRDFLATANQSTPDGTGTNKTTNLPTGTPVNALFTQTGVNLALFSINDSGQYSAEIAGALHLTGGQLWEYDGVRPVEHGFHVWAENLAYAFSATGGSMAAQPPGYVASQPPYFYQFCYEWTDNAGQLHRSAPSIPLAVTTTGTATTGSVTLYVPTLRLTYKTSPNPVRIVGYRWSVAQQIYYQFTSLTSPVLNDPTVDYVTIVDTKSDAQILGSPIIYTTGGVIENIGAPASIASCLFNNRLWLVNAEDPNSLWYSKQVIENTPVEMSDLLTIYVAPTIGAQGSTGPVTALSAMDDKLIIFKKDAAYYINGIGPDNTGANSGYSDPTFITGSVGCSNPNSIVLTPDGIMFQSDKGIWILTRDLQTKYIGAPVENSNGQVITSAETIPGTNQVRFILDNSTTLMYDYYFGQWGVFTNTRAIAATLWQGKHTYLNALGHIFQETPNTYLDGSTPVLMSVTTAWINVAGLQGFERFYFLNLLGTYFTPFNLSVSMAYDYNSAVTDTVMVSPDNYSPTWGGDALWGSNQAWGGNPDGNVFTARVFPTHQKCSSFQITIQENYDSSFGVAAGQGLTLSGLLMTIGLKKGYRTQSSGKSFG